MKFLFQNNRIGFHITWLSMVLKIFLYHFIRYVSRTPNPISDSPKMPAPISFRKFWIFLLQPSRCPSFQPFNNVTYVQRGTILNMDMYMIPANNPFKYFNILCITNLLNKIATPLLDVSFQNFIPIFCNPNYVCSKPRYSVTTNTLIFTHNVKLAIWVATESLALKAHSFN